MSNHLAPHALAPLPPGTQPRPFWSVIITSYKRADLLKHCLDKVLSQKIVPDRMEILIADDDPQSTLGPSVAEWSQGRALYMRNPQNIGTFPSMNAAISRSRGEWIHIVADDDWVDPDFYAVMENAIAAAPQEIGVAVSHHVHYREDSKTFDPARPLADQPGILGPAFLARLSFMNPVQIPAIVTKRQTFERLGLFREDLPYTGDWEFWFRAARKVSWLYVPGTVAYFRMHPRSQTRALLRTAQTAEDLRRMLDLIEQSLPPDMARQIMPKARAHHAIQILRNGKASLQLKLIEVAERYIREACAIHPDIINAPEWQECINHPALAHLRHEFK